MAKFDRNTSLIQLPAEHVSVLHGPARSGSVAVATRSRGWSECAIPVEDLPRYLEAVPIGQDVYVSQARFRGRRRIVNLAHLNAAWVDIDYHRRHGAWSPSEALYALLSACDAARVPLPSYVLGTGRGLAAVWLCEVLPPRALPRWQAVQAALVRALAELGADAAARDAARVLRLAGTLNTRPVPPALVRCLYPELGPPVTYGFDELCEWVLPWSRPERPREERSPAKRRTPILRLVRGRSAAQLWTDRLGDLRHLRFQRWLGPLPPGQRDVWLFVAACALAWIAPPAKVRREVRTLAAEAIGGAWAPGAVDELMGSALRRAEAAGRGETVTWCGVEVDPRYRFRTATILEWLEITADEQRALRTLLGEEERARRWSEHQAERGARGGLMSGERRREATRERDARILELHAAGVSQRAIAECLGLSRGVVVNVLRGGGSRSLDV